MPPNGLQTLKKKQKKPYSQCYKGKVPETQNVKNDSNSIIIGIMFYNTTYRKKNMTGMNRRQPLTWDRHVQNMTALNMCVSAQVSHNMTNLGADISLSNKQFNAIRFPLNALVSEI